MAKKLDERSTTLLKTLVEQYWKEDQAVRERQIRTWKRLKLFWDGMQRIWYSEVAHDWRIWDDQAFNDDGSQDFYDKPVNVFKAYLESIIAALSVLVPPIEAYPDDADNPLDIQTAKAAKKIAELIYRHNDVHLLWLKALFIYTTEGMIACYNYTHESEKYGTYKENEYADDSVTQQVKICTVCKAQIGDEILSERIRNEFDPQPEDIGVQAALNLGEVCPECGVAMKPELQQSQMIVTRLVNSTDKPKARQCLEVYGGLFVKTPNYARTQAECPYLFLSSEVHYAIARAEYPQIRDKIQPHSGSSSEPYERWGRLNTQYQGEYPLDTVTVRHAWLRHAAFEALEDKEDVEYLKEKFPSGVCVSMVEDECADYANEALDDHWTLTNNPLSDYLQFDPPGLLLTSIQEMTNDMFSLILQTIEHGIPQTFADPAVLNFNQYTQQSVSPGAIFPATPKSGRSMQEAFYEVKTASLSPEVMPFASEIQSMGQLVSGAQASLFGGQLEGSKTASEYSMSRAQALQRQQNTWKMLCSWWKQIFAKVIPAYIKDMKEDERFVTKDDSGNFMNVLLRKAELEGKLGGFELEANENLPISWTQQRDLIMQLFQANNPQILQLLATPENLPFVYEAMGITDLYIPGEDARNKQYDEIKLLVNSEPIVLPPEPEVAEMAAQSGGQFEPVPQEEPSVNIDEFDEHAVEFQICVKWINSPAGQMAKVENDKGYKNVLLHTRAHKMAMMMQMMESQQQQGQGAAPGEKPKETDKEAPIMGDGDVKPTA